MVRKTCSQKFLRYSVVSRVLSKCHWPTAGPISSVTAVGQTIVIIHDPRLAFELLEKRSAIHSSRPRQVFAGEMYVGPLGRLGCGTTR